MAFRSKLHTWYGLDPAARRAVQRALPALLASSASVRLLGFLRAHRLASRTVRAVPPWGSAEQVAEGVRLAARALPWHPKCLERSLALMYLLRRRGLDARLRIGVRRPMRGGEPAVPALSPIEAHAWVEVDGQVIGDRADVHDRFLAFDDDLSEATGALIALRR